MGDQDGIPLSSEIHLHAIHIVHPDIASADAGSLDRMLAAIGTGDLDPGCVGMGIGDIGGDIGILDAFLVRNGKDAADFFRIAVVAQDPGQKGFICTVAFVGLGKGTGQLDPDILRLALEQLVGYPPQTDGACCMGTGGTDHDRPDDIENIHVGPPDKKGYKKRSMLLGPDRAGNSGSAEGEGSWKGKDQDSC